MREAHFSHKLTEISRPSVSQHVRDTLIKEVHDETKHAETDLKPFLTVLGTDQRAGSVNVNATVWLLGLHESLEFCESDDLIKLQSQCI